MKKRKKKKSVSIRAHLWFLKMAINTLMYAEETGQIINCAMEVLNTLGHGFLEKVYENALVVEFKLRGILYQQQPRFDVDYKGVVVGEYVPDLLVFGKIVVDTKTIDAIGNHELGKMINYLRTTRLPVGLIINFKYAKLKWKRVVV